MITFVRMRGKNNIIIAFLAGSYYSLRKVFRPVIERATVIILSIIDWFYPPFKKVMPLQTFRYAACGGGNTILDIALFIFAHDFLFGGKMIHLYSVTLTAHIAAFLFSFFFTFPIGFFLSRYVVFQESTARKREQLPKYLAVVMGAILLNYFCLKVFIETMNFQAIYSKLLTTILVVAFSYFSQKYFTFKASVQTEE
jgi:putative flippase GtrA